MESPLARALCLSFSLPRPLSLAHHQPLSSAREHSGFEAVWKVEQTASRSPYAPRRGCGKCCLAEISEDDDDDDDATSCRRRHLVNVEIGRRTGTSINTWYSAVAPSHCSIVDRRSPESTGTSSASGRSTAFARRSDSRRCLVAANRSGSRGCRAPPAVDYGTSESSSCDMRVVPPLENREV